MTVLPGLTLTSLRAAKNSVIGNPIAKVQVVRDGVFISQLIHCLNPDGTLTDSRTAQDALRMEAAHIIASLSYGSEEALATLLHGNTHHALLYALSHFSPADSAALRIAFSRALRALTSSLADVAGPSLWGLRPPPGVLRGVAQQALESLFQTETMDVYLPLFAPSLSIYTISTGVLICTAQMLANTVRTPSHRRAVSEWLPPADRQKEIKSKRGWEKTATLNGNTSSPWVARQLVALFGNKDDKLTEAVLLALAALAKENPFVAGYLEKSSTEAPPLAWILDFTKSRSIDVQIAACLCITHTLRATFQFAPNPHIFPSNHASLSSNGQSYSWMSHSSNMSLHDNCIRTVMNVVNRFVGTPLPSNVAVASSMGADSPQIKTKACFVLHYLVTDNAPLCNSAFNRGCLEQIGSLIKSITPLEPAIPEWEEDEPESIAQLREAALTCLASLALWSDDVRRRITDELRLLPCISRALRAKHVGTRYAACQCVRAVSRAVSVLRTGIVDSALGMDVLRIVLGKELGDKIGGNGASTSSGNKARGNVRGLTSNNGKRKEMSNGRDADAMDADVIQGSGKQPKLGEDSRVLSAALSAVCNIVNDFSPLRPVYLEEKLMPRLVYILRESGDPSLRLNALWAVKNLVRKTSTETKRDLMSHLGWQELLSYLSDPESSIQEQGFNIIKNLAENEEGTAMVFRELPQVLGKLVEGMRSPDEDVVLQATSALANLANGTPEHQDLIIKYPQLLSTLQMCLAESTVAVRRPAVSCIHALAKANPRRRKEMVEAGIVGTLKRLTEWSGHPPGKPQGGHHGHGHSASIAGVGGLTAASSGAQSRWGGRSPIRSSTMGITGVSSGTVSGSWEGSSLHHNHPICSLDDGHGHALAAATGLPTRPHLIGLDDREVVQNARDALEWLEHGETVL